MRTLLVVLVTVAALALAGCQPQAQGKDEGQKAAARPAAAAAAQPAANQAAAPADKGGEAAPAEAKVEEKVEAAPAEAKVEEKPAEAAPAEAKVEEKPADQPETAAPPVQAEEQVEEAKPVQPAVATAAEVTVVTTATGLKYEDTVVGTGASPTNGKRVTVHYTGWLTNGTKFDSSVDRGQPFVFPIGMGRVIKGWDEGVLTMKVGGKRKLTIPPELGYGPRGAGGVIPPNATLVFEVELLGVD